MGVGWLLAAVAGCRCPQTALLMISVLYLFHAKKKNFLLLFFSLRRMQPCQYSLIRASEW